MVGKFRAHGRLVGPDGPLSTRRVPVAGLNAADEAAWRRLESTACEVSLNGPDYALAAAAHLPTHRPMELFAVERDGELVAALPLFPDERGRRPHRVLASRAAPPVLPAGPPLLARDDPVGAAGALLDLIGRTARRDRWPGVLLLERVNDDGPATEAVRAAARTRLMPVLTVDRWDRSVIRRRPEPEFWLSGLSGERRKKQRKNLRQLTEELGGPPILVDRADDPTAIDEFLRIEASGWKGREGTAMGSDPDTEAFFRDWAARTARHGALHLFCFGLDDKPVAVYCAVRLRDELHLYKIGSDDAYSRHAPGVLMVAAVAEHFGRNESLALLDSLTDPGNEHFAHLFPDRRTYVNLAVAVGGLRDRSGLGALAAIRDPRIAPRLRRLRATAGKVRSLAPPAGGRSSGHG